MKATSIFLASDKPVRKNLEISLFSCNVIALIVQERCWNMSLYDHHDTCVSHLVLERLFYGI